MIYYLIKDDNKNKKVSIGVNGNLIIRNKNPKTNNVYFDNVSVLCEDELIILNNLLVDNKDKACCSFIRSKIRKVLD